MTVKPPAHLTAPTKRWFAAVVADYALDEHHIRLLTLAAEAWDRTQEAREVIKAEGMTYSDRFRAPRKHPAVGIEESARIAFARLLRELDLDGDPTPDVRPPRRGGR